MQFRQDLQLNKAFVSSSTKFKACKIQKNGINFHGAMQDESDYIFEEKLAQSKVFEQQKQNINKINCQNLKQQIPKNEITKNNLQLVKSLMEQLIYPNFKAKHVQLKSYKQQQNIDNKINQQDQEQDLTHLWNTLQAQTEEQVFSQNNKINNQKNLQNRSKNAEVSVSNDSDSSCQLTEQQLERWMKKCQQQEKINSKSEKIQRHSQRNNCIYHMEDQINENVHDKFQLQLQEKLQQKDSVSKDDQKDWGSWAEIVQFMEKQNQNKLKYENQTLKNVVNSKQKGNEDVDFVIIDSVCQIQEQFVQTNTKLQTQPQNNRLVYGPWIYNTNNYQIFQKYKLKLIHYQNLGLQTIKQSKLTQQNLRSIYKSARSIRKINWQITEQKKPQIKKLRSKRNCRMNLIQFGKDFLIFDHRKFVLSQICEGSHTYLGVRVFGNFQQYFQKQNIQQNGRSSQIKELKQFLYLPSSGECLIETVHPSILNSLNQKQIRTFDICLSLTGEKIAVCQRKIMNQQNDKKQIIEVKYYDSFQKSSLFYLGIVESKTSNFGGQWYCDTVIYIPKIRSYNNKINENDWYKFKIQIRLSQLGTIVAQLGIFDAESSVTNCILFGQNKYSQFMMGSIQQSQRQINYILRIAGISPLMAFAATLSRKIFVFS